MPAFMREPRYIVFKIKDLETYEDCVAREAIRQIGNRIAVARRAHGKPPFNALVVEQDWPEFEPTWAAIEARCKGESPRPASCTWRLDEDGLWQTDCKNAFLFNDDGPKANGFKVCPYCGKPLLEA